MNPNESKPCPYCNALTPQKLGFTWWGGMIGAPMLGIWRCGNCHKSYRPTSGQPATLAISMYLTVSVIIGLALGLVLFFYLSGRM